MSRISIHRYYLSMLELAAARSTCARRAVAAIITDDSGVVLGIGYNGVPRGLPHCIETPCDGTKDEPGNTRNCLAVHAEANAIMQCSPSLTRASKIYVSCFPCFECSKLIANTPIKNVYATHDYADTRGKSLLTKVGIEFIVFNGKL